MLEFIQKWRERNYELLDNTNTSSFCIVISKNTINKAQLMDKLIILKGPIKFINRGDITGVIYSEEGDLFNEGKIEGIIYCEKGAYSVKKQSHTLGQVISNRLIVQPGATMDGTVNLEGDKNDFICAIEESDFRDKKHEILKRIEVE